MHLIKLLFMAALVLPGWASASEIPLSASSEPPAAYVQGRTAAAVGFGMMAAGSVMHGVSLGLFLASTESTSALWSEESVTPMLIAGGGMILGAGVVLGGIGLSTGGTLSMSISLRNRGVRVPYAGLALSGISTIATVALESARLTFDRPEIAIIEAGTSLLIPAGLLWQFFDAKRSLRTAQGDLFEVYLAPQIGARSQGMAVVGRF